MAFIIDVFSRRLVGWKASRSMTADLVVDALNMAAWTRRHTSLENLVCHTDAGNQYTSILYTDRIDEIGAAPSIGTVGDSYDNAMAESVMGIFKTELHRNPAVLAGNGGHWKGLDDLEIATCWWVPGATRSDCTATSATSRQPKSKRTVVSRIRPRWRERTKRKGLHYTQIDSL